MEEQTPAPAPVEELTTRPDGAFGAEAEAKAAAFDRKQVEDLTAEKVKLLQENAQLKSQVEQLSAASAALQRTIVATCEKLTR